MRRAGIVLAVLSVATVVWYSVGDADRAAARDDRIAMDEPPSLPAGDVSPAVVLEGAARLRTESAVESGPEGGVSQRAAVAGAGTGPLALEVRLDFECGNQPFRWPELHFTSRGGGEVLDVLAGARERIDPFPAGDWFVSVESSAWTGGQLDVPEERGVLELPVESRVRYTGMLVDAATLEPLPAFQMTLEYGSRDLQGRRVTFFETVDVDGGDGVFCATGLPVSDGPMRLVFTAEGFGEARTDWLPESSGTRVDGLFVELGRLDEGWISGRVTSAETGRASEDAWVCLVSASATSGSMLLVEGGPMLMASGIYRPGSPPNRWRATTDTDGEFRLSADHGRPLRLYVWKPGLLPHVTDVLAMPEAGDLRVETIELTRGARILGRVVGGGDDPGHAPQGVWIEGAGTERRVGIGEAGAFVIEGLAAGTYDLGVDVLEELPDGSTTLMVVQGERVALEAGEEREVEILLGAARPGAVLSGSVLAPSDPELVEWRLGAIAGSNPATGLFHNQALDPTGAFTIHGTPEGRVYLASKGKSASGDRVAWAFLRLEVGPEGRTGIVLDAARNPVTIGVGEPAAGAARVEFSLEPLGGDALVRQALSLDRGLVGLKGGTLTLYGLEPGDYRLRCDTLVQEFSVVEDTGATVYLEWGE